MVMSRAHHISQQFDKELEDIRSRVLAMGGLVEEHLAQVLESLSRPNLELAEYVAANDFKVNNMEVEIDAECTAILLRRQPAAGDLRLVLAISKVNIICNNIRVHWKGVIINPIFVLIKNSNIRPIWSIDCYRMIT